MQPLGVNKVQKCTFWKEVPLIPEYCDTLCWFVISKWKKVLKIQTLALIYHLSHNAKRFRYFFTNVCMCTSASVFSLQSWSYFAHLRTRDPPSVSPSLSLSSSSFALRYELYCFTLASFYASVSFKHNRFTSYMHGPTAERNKALNVEACSRD